MSSSMDSQSMDMVPPGNGGSPAFPLTAKGDLLTHDGVSEAIRTIGANDTVLTADDTNPLGLAWKTLSGGSPVVTDADAILGISGDNSIPNAGDTIKWNENGIFGDVSKIVELPLGRFKLSGAIFVLSAIVSITLTGGGSQSASINWQQSSTELGTYTTISNPNGRQGTFHTGNTTTSTKEKATAIIDARSADVFVQAFLKPDGASTATVHNLSAEGSIDSFGTSAVANTPLTTKGDVLTHNGTNEVRLPVGLDNQVLVVDPLEASGLNWVPRGFEVIADETLGVAASTFDVSFPAKEFLYVVLFLEADSGNLNAEFNFNDDLGNNYAFRRDENFGTISTETNADRVPLDPATVDEHVNGTIIIFNQPSIESSFLTDTVSVIGLTAASLPTTQRIKGTWYDTAQITKLNVTTTINTFSTNSRIIVLGSHV